MPLDQSELGHDAKDSVLEFVDSIIGPDRMIDVRIQDPAMRAAVKAELERRGCQVSLGEEPDVLVVVCP